MSNAPEVEHLDAAVTAIRKALTEEPPAPDTSEEDEQIEEAMDRIAQVSRE